MTYQEALNAGKKAGASRCTDAELMAMLCESPLQLLVGAVAPRLVWEGAMAQGLTSKELMRLAHDDPAAVHELMWTERTST